MRPDVEKYLREQGWVFAGVSQPDHKRQWAQMDGDKVKRVALESELEDLALSAIEHYKEEKLEEELDKWRHDHFYGERDGHFSGEYLERTSQLELARHFNDLGKRAMKEQITSDAIEGYVERDCGGQLILGRENSPASDEFMLLDSSLFPEIHTGRKCRVRIIVIKEDKNENENSKN